MTNADIIVGLNSLRASIGEQPLTESPTLDVFATWKAQDMCNNNYWAHNSPTSTWLNQMVTHHIYYQSAGENLAYGFTDTSTMVTAWHNSPEHWTNISNASFQNIGVGIVRCASFQGASNQIIVSNEFTHTSVATAPAAPAPTPVQPVAPVQAPAVTKTATVQPAKKEVLQPTHTASMFSLFEPITIAVLLLVSVGIWFKKHRK